MPHSGLFIELTVHMPYIGQSMTSTWIRGLKAF